MRLVGYLRVSTDEQVRNGNGLDIQRAAVLGWAESHGHKVVGWCSDEGISGSTVDRPGLLDVYDLLEQDYIDGVIAQTDTRFGRSLEAQEAFFGRVWSLRKSVFTVDIGEVHEDDPNDPMRTAMRRMRAIMAELEAGLIRKRMRDGKEASRSQGRYQGGPVPFGWRAMDGYYVPHEGEQAVLQYIADGRAAGKTWYRIGEDLNEAKRYTQNGYEWTITKLRRQLAPGQHPLSRRTPS